MAIGRYKCARNVWKVFALFKNELLALRQSSVVEERIGGKYSYSFGIENWQKMMPSHLSFDIWRLFATYVPSFLWIKTEIGLIRIPPIYCGSFNRLTVKAETSFYWEEYYYFVRSTNWLCELETSITSHKSWKSVQKIIRNFRNTQPRGKTAEIPCSIRQCLLLLYFFPQKEQVIQKNQSWQLSRAELPIKAVNERERPNYPL